MVMESWRDTLREGYREGVDVSIALLKRVVVPPPPRHDSAALLSLSPRFSSFHLPRRLLSGRGLPHSQGYRVPAFTVASDKVPSGMAPRRQATT